MEGVLNVIGFSEQEKLDDLMIKIFCKPRFETGTEWIIKDQANDQANGAFGGIARAIFDRLFKFLIEKCNVTLVNPTLKREKFCAALDIAGFKIFKCNSSEQISIDFADKKLRQFSSHHMFVVEQEEHAKEGIDWAMVDLGMGLAVAVIMVEKSMGILAILEEESLFPKATDKSFEEKLKASFVQLSVFLKLQSKAISHYASIVSGNVTGWLGKGKIQMVGRLTRFLSDHTCELEYVRQDPEVTAKLVRSLQSASPAWKSHYQVTIKTCTRDTKGLSILVDGSQPDQWQDGLDVDLLIGPQGPAQDAPDVQDAPVAQDALDARDAPRAQDAPDAQDAPVAQDALDAQDAPTARDAPVVQDVPAAQDDTFAPATQEAPNTLEEQGSAELMPRRIGRTRRGPEHYQAGFS